MSEEEPPEDPEVSTAPVDVLEIASRRHAPEGHDLVLVDAPCSSSGALRRHPDLRWSRQWGGDSASSAARRALPGLQLELLRRAAALTKVGGRIVYATCALDTRENQAVAAAFEAESAKDGLRKLVRWTFPPAVPGRHHDIGELHCRTVWPHQYGDASPDGFFIARWRIEDATDQTEA